MIALAAFVIEAKDALLSDHKGQAVFVAVRTAGRGLRQAPDHQLSKSVLADRAPFAEQQHSGSVGVYTNTRSRSILSAWLDFDRRSITAIVLAAAIMKLPV